MNKPVVFLDRDGVINTAPERHHYVTRPGEFSLIDGAAEAIKKLNDARILAIVISNQQGVGLGKMTMHDLEQIEDRMCTALQEKGARIDAAYYCTHTKEENCACRKPKPGLIEQAKKELNLEEGLCWLVGDMAHDIDLGAAMSCKTILVQSPLSPPEEKVIADHRVASLSEAVDLILQEMKNENN